MVKIATALWLREGAVAFWPETDDDEGYRCKYGNRSSMKVKIRINLHSLPLPHLIERQLLDIVWLMEEQIYHWHRYLHYNFRLERINLQNIRWTPHGTIDKTKSVLILVKNPQLDAIQRFRLACNYCLTEEIRDLISTAENVRDSGEFLEHRLETLVTFWRCYFTDRPMNVERAELHVFQSAVLSINATAAKYVFENLLNPAEKSSISSYTEQVLRGFESTSCHAFCPYTPKEFFPDLFCSMLSRMELVQQMEMFRDYTKQLLGCLLCRPYRCFFVDTAKRMWRFINRDLFYYLLFKIFYKIHSQVSEYRDIFCQFWNFGSLEYRKYVVNDDSFFEEMLYEMCLRGEKYICRMMLRALNAKEKDDLLFDVDRLGNFYRKVYENKEWKVLEFFLKECASSAEMISEVKQLTIEQHVEATEEQTREILQILDTFIADVA